MVCPIVQERTRNPGASSEDSSLTAACAPVRPGQAHLGDSFLNPMGSYRVKYSLYRIEGSDAADAKKQVCEIMKRMPEKFISVEDATVATNRPLWKRFLTGK